LEQSFSSVGERNGPRGTGQKPDSKPRFQLADNVAERRLRYAQLRRRSRKALLPGDRQKGHQVIDALAWHSRAPSDQIAVVLNLQRLDIEIIVNRSRRFR
jgi:hypothetical protein